MAKKEDISNATLATLLVVAIVVSVGGTYVVLQRTPGITGMYTGTSQTGTVSFTEQGVLSIVLTDAAVSFGTIQSTGAGLCTVTSNSAAGSGTNCNKTAGADIMVLQNDGNVNASVAISATSLNLGTGGSFKYQGATAPTRDGGCTGTLTSSFTAFSGADICTKMVSDDAADQFGIDFELKIGTDLGPGAQSANVTFVATQV